MNPRQEGNWAVREEYQNRHFVTVNTRLLNDERVRRLTEDGERVFLHLLIHPGTVSIPGLVLASEAQMAERMRWPIQRFRDAFAELVREEIAEADWEAGLVWMHKGFKHRWPAGPKVVQSWRKLLLQVLPECALLRRAMGRIRDGLRSVYQHPVGFTEAFEKAVPEGFSIPYPEGYPEPYAQHVGSKIVDLSASARAHARDDQHPLPQDEGVGVGEVRESPIPPPPPEPADGGTATEHQAEPPRQEAVAGCSEVIATDLNNVLPFPSAPVHGPRERLWARLQGQREKLRGYVAEPIERVFDKDTGEDTLETARILYGDDPLAEMHLGYLATDSVPMKGGGTKKLELARPGWPWDLFKRNADRYFRPEVHAANGPPVPNVVGEVSNAF